jgi:imidazolonepropionase-like amidohydrolase
MATINGAAILGIENSHGSLAPGKKAIMLAVKGIGTHKLGVYERLVHAGAAPQVNIVQGLNG